MKYRIRKKGAKYVLERKPIDGKWQGRTLLPTERLWKCMCPDTNNPNVSEGIGKEDPKKGEKFGQELLNESLPTPKNPIDEDTKRKLWEMSK